MEAGDTIPGYGLWIVLLYDVHMPKAILLIAKQGFQDVELDGTCKGLLAAGFEVTLVSTEAGECIGKFGGKETATVAARDMDVDAFDRFAFIGGPGAHAFKDDPDILNLAHRIAESGKIFGAICIAPTALAAAGVLKGKKATVWNGDGEQGTFIESHGAMYTGEHVTVDGRIVTADGPETAEEFGRVLAAI
ncbi:MAG: protease I [Candidatus Peregrinibacteria bacterium Greene0416_19]|nr:MAG: protease I [Candidatus Peregrinibacteria bacterium Greene0416_19]